MTQAPHSHTRHKPPQQPQLLGTKSDLSKVNGHGKKKKNPLNGGVASLQHGTVSWRNRIKDWQGKHVSLAKYYRDTKLVWIKHPLEAKLRAACLKGEVKERRVSCLGNTNRFAESYFILWEMKWNNGLRWTHCKFKIILFKGENNWFSNSRLL